MKLFLSAALFTTGSLAAATSGGCTDGQGNFANTNKNIQPETCKSSRGSYFCDNALVQVIADQGTVTVSAGNNNVLVDVQCGGQDVIINCARNQIGYTSRCTGPVTGVIAFYNKS